MIPKSNLPQTSNTTNHLYNFSHSSDLRGSNVRLSIYDQIVPGVSEKNLALLQILQAINLSSFLGHLVELVFVS